MRIAKRGSVKGAKVALARRLAVVMHRMWTDGTDFRWSTQPNGGADRSLSKARTQANNPSSADQAERSARKGARVG